MAATTPSKPTTKGNDFKYGFTVHSLSKVNSPSKSSPKKKNQNKKNQKRKNQHNKKKNQQQHNIRHTLPPPSIEIYTSSCSRILDIDHLNALSASSFHDLQCGTGTFALQSFLEYPNLKRVFGIEQNKNLFHFATKNLLSLIKNGFKGNKYLLVEQIPSTKMTIAQKSNNNNKSFTKGDVVYAFISLKQNNITKRDNYQGVIRSVNNDGIHYDIEMSFTKKVSKNIHRDCIFKPGNERTFEIVRGNLFERSDSFRADIVVLPYSISNDSFKSLLLTGCKRSPIGSRILSYSHLELWDGYPVQSLRRIDANVYDNDRYITNLSLYQKLYIYSHTLSLDLASSPSDIVSNCSVNSDVLVRDQQQHIWYTAKVLKIDIKNRKIQINKNNFIGNTGINIIKIDEQRIHLIKRLFKKGDIVNAYCPKMIEKDHKEMYTLYRGQIVNVNANGTYAVQYSDGETHPKVSQYMIFNLNKSLKFEENNILYGKRYDMIKFNKNVNKISSGIANDDNNNDNDENDDIIKFKNTRNLKVSSNKCIIRHINPDGTYRVEFYNLPKLKYHDSFCEYWLYNRDNKTDDDDDDYNINPSLPLSLEIDYDRISLWRPNLVSHWLNKCGIDIKYCNIFLRHGINGIFLFDIDLDLICNDLRIPPSIASSIMSYIRSLKNEVGSYHTNEDEEKMKLIQINIQNYKNELILQKEELSSSKLLLQKLIQSNQSEYKKYEDWELKISCITLANKKVSKKDIAAQLKKAHSWVKKTSKLNIKQIKKPSGNIIKEIEKLKFNINKNQKNIKQFQLKLKQSKSQLNDLLQ